MNVDTESIPDDLFQVIFIARATPSPWQALLVYSILLHNPVLSVLAACDEVNTTTKLNYFIKGYFYLVLFLPYYGR